MTIDKDSASASLQEIESVQQRTRETLIYGGASASLLVWGVLVAAGYLLSYFRLSYDGKIWIGIMGAGMAFSLIFHNLSARNHARSWDRRLSYAMLVLVAFGIYWAALIGPTRAREMGAFWPTLFMFGYVVSGLWLGRFFTLCGVAVTVLTIAAYLWAGPWFDLAMAGINGFGLIAGGLWLRRMGQAP